MRRFLGNILVSLVGLIVVLGIIEFGVRWLAVHRVYEFPKGMYTSDELLNYRLTPNFKGRHLSANYEWDIVIETNSEGFWDYEHGPKKGFRILGVGDSFTFPFGVGIDKGYLGVLEKNLGVEIVKTGVPGYDPIDYLNFIRAKGMGYEPDLVVLGVYIGNDIHGKSIQVKQNKNEPVAKPSPGFWTQFARTVPTFLRNNYYTYGFVMDRVKSSPYLREIVNLAATDMRKMLVPEVAFMKVGRRDEQSQKMWDLLETRLLEINQIIEDRGAKLAIAIIPTDYQVYDEVWRRVLAQHQMDASAFDRSKPNRDLVAFCQKNQIHVIDLLPASLQAAEQGQQLYFQYNRHWAEEGNALAAKTIQEYIMAHGLIPRDALGKNN